MRGHVLLLLAAILLPASGVAGGIRDRMTPAQFRAAGLHKLTSKELATLDAWFLGRLGQAFEGAEAMVRLRRPVANFDELLGASILADDGEFLGKISRSTIDPDSIMNTMSPHGSSLGTSSIFNSLGQYGSSLSNSSPFHSLATSPPKLVKNGQILGYLTKNSMKQPAFDPDEVLAWLSPNRKR